jgi:glycosyltransferase involved in cell wall biosynthesis
MPLVSIFIATYNRADVLKRTLESMCGLENLEGLAEIIVADNHSTDHTKATIESFQERLPLRYCFEPKQGKNAALNRTVEMASGSLFVFTDDDVLVEPDWLVQWSEGVARWRQYDVFGGPILPEWPGAVPEYIFTLPSYEMTYCVLDAQQEEGLFVEGRPFGPNLGIRSRIFREEGFRFNENVGPSQGNYIMGSESELLKRLETAGRHAIYLPQIGVRHIIRAEQLTPQWLYGRAFRYGRSLRYSSRDEIVKTLFGVPRYLLGYLATTILRRVKHLVLCNRAGYICEGVKYWMIRGQLRQARIDRAASGRT